MLWVIVESGKLEKTKVRRNLVGARSLERLGTLGRLGLEGFLMFMYYAEDFGFLFDNTSMCCLCVCISLPLIFAI